MRTTRQRACLTAASAAVFAALTLGGCGHGKYTDAHRKEATRKMQAIKAGTEYGMANQAFMAGDLDKALTKIEQSISLNDRVPKTHVLKGRILLEMGDLGASLDSLLAAEAIDPSFADAQYFMGVVYERLGDLPLAEAKYRAACELENYSPGFAVAAAEAMIDQEKLAEAKAYLNDGPMFEHNAYVQQTLGQIALLEREHDSALEYFTSAHLLAPEDNGILEDVINTQMLVGEYGRAETNLARLRNNPENRKRTDLKHLHAECYAAIDQPQRARELYQEIVDNLEGASDVEAWIGIANTSYVMGDTRMMRRAAARVVALEPKEADGYSLFALFYRQNGDIENAVRSIETAIVHAPDDASLYAFKGLLFSEVKQFENAAVAFREASRLEPSNSRYRSLAARASRGEFAVAPTGDN